MNKKIALLITIFSFFIFTSSAFAALGVTASISGTGVAVNISGAAADSDIAIVVYAPNDSLPTGPVLQIKDTKANSGGAVVFNFSLPEIAPTGTYIVKVSGQKISAETTFSYTNTLLIDRLGQVNSESEIKSLIENYGETAALNMSDYWILPAQNQAKIITAIKNGKGSGSLTDTKLVEIFDKALAIESVAASNSSATGELSIIEVLNKHSRVLEINLASSDYNLLTDEGKANFRSLFANKDYQTIENLQTAFSDTALIAYFRNSSWPGIQSYTALSSAYRLSFDLGYKYQGLNDKSLPFKAIVNQKNTIAAVSDIVRIFNESVNIEYDNQGNGSGGVSGNNGGSSGGSVSMGRELTGSDIPTPIVVEDEGLFKDLEEAPWAIEYIERLYAMEVVNGVGDNLFSPNTSVTREQFLKMIMLAFDYEIESGDTSFIDINSEEWYAPYVNTGVKSGIINGMSETEFGTGREISRQDMVVILMRALSANGAELLRGDVDIYSDDSEISDYAKEAVYTMTSCGVINGMGDNLFAPAATATRAAASKVVAISIDILN